MRLAPVVLVTFPIMVALLALGTTACLCEQESDDPGILYTEGAVHGELYESSPLTGPWLQFVGGRRFRLKHKLDVRPECIQVTPYLAFSEYPVPAAAGGATTGLGDSTIGSGSSIVIERIDSEHIVLHNSSCSDFYIRILARADRSEACVGFAGAGGAAGAAGQAGAAQAGLAGVAGTSGR